MSRLARDVAHLSSRPDADKWRAAWRAKERWYERWERSFEGVTRSADAHLDLPAAVARARVTKAQQPPPPPPSSQPPPPGTPPAASVAAVLALLRAQPATDLFARGAQALYVGLALDEGEDAGQFTLDALGINKTFKWAGQRDFVRDRTAVRGSKILTAAYDNHLERLADVIVRATDPADPQTVADVIGLLREEWDALARKDAARIARTETGVIWERTNWYAMRANGVTRVRWLLAHGPAIGKTAALPCPRCVAAAEASPYLMDTMTEIPPLHPNCRCTLVPVLDPRWLPPTEPWTGSESPLPLRGFDTPSGTTVPPDAPVQKARRAWGDPTVAGWATPGLGWSA